MYYIMSENLSGYTSGEYIFNPNDFSSSKTIDTETLQEIISELDPIYVNVNGSDVMNGDLTAKSVTITDYVQFNDNTLQTTAFNANSLTAIQNQITTMQNSLTTDEADIATLKTKNTAITYNSGQTKTTIADNCLINSLTCNNFNTSHLAGTSDIVQNQINTSSNNISTLLNKTRNIQSADSISTTVVKELRLKSSSTSINDSSLTFNDLSIQTTAFTDAINTLITNINSLVKYISSDNNNNTTIAGTVTTGNVITGGNITVGANLNANDILINNVSIKNRIVPVGSIQMYAGNAVPSGYFLCNGASISKTTYNELFGIIGNLYLNGRTASSTNFYLPDLRGMFVRGTGTNTTYSGVVGGGIGTYQSNSVQKHIHKYDKANNTINVQASEGGALGNNSSVWDNSSDRMNTGSTILDVDEITLLTDETRPHCISLNYIIKF